MSAAAMDQELVLGRWSHGELTDTLLRPLAGGSRAWRWLLLVSGLGTLMLATAVLYSFTTGVGVWGNNIPNAWGFPIINFVWWIGIGHAGTFISAILLLLEQRWRTSLNRLAEAMTLFALVQAALFPLLHLGRPWFFYWLVPYPSTMGTWPQFSSVLTWDVAAVSTYTLVSILFWYLGLIPDLATVRDRAKSLRVRRIYGLFALGWRGSARDWKHHRSAQLILAGLATPLVLSVHSVVSMDFATSKLAGWHSTIFPPYFVAGAIFSGFAMVITLLIPIRRIFGLDRLITSRHLDLVGKLTLITGLLVAFSYVCENFVAWYGASEFERHVFFETRPFGAYAWIYWSMIGCNVLVPQALWLRRVRTNPWALFAIAVVIQLGMWAERFVLIVTSTHQDFLPSSWGMYVPSLIDGAILLGTVCFFCFLMLLLVRFVPFVSIAEQKELIHETGKQEVEHA